MRTLAQITISLKQAFVDNATLREAYGLDPALTFDAQFSPVSIEAALVNVVAFIVHAHEWLWSAKERELERKALLTLVGTSGWYEQKLREFQNGHELTYHPDGTYRYATPDPAARIVRRVAMSPMEGGLFIKVAAEDEQGNAIQLTAEQLLNLGQYLWQIRMAGTRMELVSLPPDRLQASIDLYFSGSYTAARDAAIAALHGYLAALPFDGAITRGNLITELNGAAGIDDVYIHSLHQRYGAAAPVPIARAAVPVSGYWALDGADNQFGVATPNANGSISLNNEGNVTLTLIPSTLIRT